MDTTTARAVAKFIPPAESPNWSPFVLVLVVMLVVTLALGPRALDSWRRFRYTNNPEIERRAEPPCQAHMFQIEQLKAKVEQQEEELSDLRISFFRELEKLRDFIDDKFREDRSASQTERLAMESRISAQINTIIDLIPRARAG